MPLKTLANLTAYLEAIQRIVASEIQGMPFENLPSTIQKRISILDQCVILAKKLEALLDRQNVPRLGIAFVAYSTEINNIIWRIKDCFSVLPPDFNERTDALFYEILARFAIDEKLMSQEHQSLQISLLRKAKLEIPDEKTAPRDFRAHQILFGDSPVLFEPLINAVPNRDNLPIEITNLSELCVIQYLDKGDFNPQVFLKTEIDAWKETQQALFREHTGNIDSRVIVLWEYFQDLYHNHPAYLARIHNLIQNRTSDFQMQTLATILRQGTSQKWFESMSRELDRIYPLTPIFTDPFTRKAIRDYSCANERVDVIDIDKLNQMRRPILDWDSPQIRLYELDESWFSDPDAIAKLQKFPILWQTEKGITMLKGITSDATDIELARLSKRAQVASMDKLDLQWNPPPRSPKAAFFAGSEKVVTARAVMANVKVALRQPQSSLATLEKYKAELHQILSKGHASTGHLKKEINNLIRSLDRKIEFMAHRSPQAKRIK